MAKKRRRNRRPPVGAAPGLQPVPQEPVAAPMTLIRYTEQAVEERPVERVEDALNLLGKGGVWWLNIDGSPPTAVLQTLGERLKLHPLALEDVQQADPRPKLDSYETHEFLVMTMVTMAEELEMEQVAVFLGADYVVTIQQRPGDVFEPVRERIRRDGSMLRTHGSDYLVYALLDTTVDAIFPVMEKYSDRIADAENDVIDNPVPELVHSVHAMKRDLLALRRAVWPMREVISAMQRPELKYVQETTRIYLRDCYDHLIRIMDMIETYRDLLGGIMDVYLSSVSNRTNEVMKVLTIIATVFIPLTFVAGIYGMNFDTTHPLNMPELHLPYGYVLFWIVCLAVAGAMVYYFRRKRWL